jgi:hypothetical protein
MSEREREDGAMDLLIEDHSIMSGVLMIVGIVGAFVLAGYSLTLPPPITAPDDRRADEKVNRIYTRHDLWRW